MKEAENDPGDPSLVVEVMAPGRDIWIPQLVNAQGVMRMALCKTSMRAGVLSRFEQIYGAGRVRLVPLEGYEPDPRAEELRQQMQQQSMPAIFGATGDANVGRMGKVGLTGAIFTLFISADGVGEASVNILITPSAGVVVCPTGPNGEIVADVKLLEMGADDPRVAQLRMGWQLVFQWVIVNMVEITGKLREHAAAQQNIASS